MTEHLTPEQLNDFFMSNKRLELTLYPFQPLEEANFGFNSTVGHETPSELRYGWN